MRNWSGKYAWKHVLLKVISTTRKKVRNNEQKKN